MVELLSPGTDRRRSARLDTHLQGLVTNNWQEQCSGLVTNIASEGLRLEGTRELVDIVFPNFNVARPAPRHAICLRLALEEGVRMTDGNAIDICCNSIYVFRQRSDWFQLGLNYAVIDTATASQLEAFIVALQRSQSVT